MHNTDPAQVEWQLWYEDTFDRETPRQIDASGRDLVQGLIALWQHHLKESVTAQGGRGFSRFNLWLVEEKQSISINGEAGGQSRLRAWVFHRGSVNAELLYRIALKHSQYVLRGENAEAILEQAFMQERDAFDAWLVV